MMKLHCFLSFLNIYYDFFEIGMYAASDDDWQ
jgi:hypothetical protein